MAENEVTKLAEAIDLSNEIAAYVERDEGDQVRCTRVGESRYRCNWWSRQVGANPERGRMSGLGCTEMRVRKSVLMEVRRTADGLMIRDVSDRSVR